MSRLTNLFPPADMAVMGLAILVSVALTALGVIAPLAAVSGCVAALALRPRLMRKRPDGPRLLVDAVQARAGVLMLVHVAQSEKLTAVETALRAQCRCGDVTGRVGRKVLVVFFDGAGPMAGAGLANRMMEAAQQLWPAEQAECRAGWIWKSEGDAVSQSLQLASAVLTKAQADAPGTVLRASRCGTIRRNAAFRKPHAVAPGIKLFVAGSG